MAPTEKEYNGNLLEQLERLDRIEAVATEEGASKTLAAVCKEKEWINRKLYQKPPMTEEK